VNNFVNDLQAFLREQWLHPTKTYGNYNVAIEGKKNKKTKKHVYVLVVIKIKKLLCNVNKLSWVNLITHINVDMVES
jgi:hypothetical protein